MGAYRNPTSSPREIIPTKRQGYPSPPYPTLYPGPCSVNFPLPGPKTSDLTLVECPHTHLYLQEYAEKESWINRVIQTNLDNLAGVPSIVYGILGFALFVRAIALVTSGAFFGILDSNGRTILSAGLTMTLLILPILLINAQEAIRAVPDSLRQASYGLGATQWQTIWHHVLPSAS